MDTDPQPRHAEVRAYVLPLLIDKLATARKATGMSQERLAAAAELDRTLITRIERGHANIEIVTLVKLARALKTTPSALLDGIE